MKIKNLSIVAILNLLFFSFLYPCNALSISEKINEDHPFYNKTETGHAIALHISCTPDRNIWFLIQSVEELPKNQKIDTIKTGHNIKKLIYDPYEKSLMLMGYKYTNASDDCN